MNIDYLKEYKCFDANYAHREDFQTFEKEVKEIYKDVMRNNEDLIDYKEIKSDRMWDFVTEAVGAAVQEGSDMEYSVKTIAFKIAMADEPWDLFALKPKSELVDEIDSQQIFQKDDLCI